jgi:hypothetical protein
MNNIIINNSNVVFNTPQNLPKKEKHFKRMLKLGKLRLYLTWNYRLKNSQQRDQARNHNGIVQVKNMLWKKYDGHCQICGKKIEKYGYSQLHHILNWYRFPEYETDERNLLLLCRDCHSHIHKEPFLECRMIEDKCKELGINFKVRYDYGEEDKLGCEDNPTKAD